MAERLVPQALDDLGFLVGQRRRPELAAVEQSGDRAPALYGDMSENAAAGVDLFAAEAHEPPVEPGAGAQHGEEPLADRAPVLRADETALAEIVLDDAVGRRPRILQERKELDRGLHAGRRSHGEVLRLKARPAASAALKRSDDSLALPG